ncbi:MAG: peptidoglycan bridge formation glycyltransferase FemA/FemB family protein [Chloroflexi bacterium]|nr:peptidoglycan bridge formation glycyltransferase FemA/FemB family protein [Chloroflexota bacterium]
MTAGATTDAAVGPRSLHLASEAELEGWDTRAVEVPGGHVLQSRAWAEYRAAHGWRTWQLVYDDGFPLLVVGRDRPVIGGGWAYASRGPIPEPDPERGAARAAAAADFLAGQGMDALIVDGETPFESGLADQLRAHGFEPTEELQPSRHRMDLQLPVRTSDDEILRSFAATTRNLIRQAERRGLRVVRLDARPWSIEEPYDPPAPEDEADPTALFTTFYGMLDATARRVGFALASQAAFLDWSKRALAAGHLVYLQAVDADGEPVAGATFYRHGERLTYSLAGDRAELRKSHPGAVRLLLWRGIQIALREGRETMDLGGGDVRGARGRPKPDDETYGKYQFKASFGGRWVELTGAHQRTMRPLRHAAGRVLGRLAALGR